MELNVSAGCSTLLGTLFSAGCSTLLAGSRASPLEVRKNARMTQYTAARSCVAMRVTELRLNGNEDERHYDAVLNNYMHTHTHTHTHMQHSTWVLCIYTHIIAYIERHLGHAMIRGVSCLPAGAMCETLVDPKGSNHPKFSNASYHDELQWITCPWARLKRKRSSKLKLS